MKPTTKEYHEQIANLEERFNDVNHLHGQRDALKAEAEQHRDQREKVLAGAVADTSEQAIDDLAKHNARAEVFSAKTQCLEGQIEDSEEQLQHSFTADFIGSFQTLHRALLRHRFERAKAHIAKLVVPERVVLLNSEIERLATQSQEYAAGQLLELYVPDGASAPLRDTFPGSPWTEYRPQTVQIILQAVEGAIEKAKQLLAVVEAEKDFTPPEIVFQSTAPAAVEIKESELVEA